MEIRPVLIKDLREQMRDSRYYIVSVIYVFMLSAIVVGMFWAGATGKNPPSSDYAANILLIFFVMLTLAISIICPALSLRSVFSEKKMIFELKTPLKPGQIITGKAISIFIYTLFLICASIPVLMPMQPEAKFLKCYSVAIISAMMFSFISILWSFVFSNFRIASLIIYFCVFIFIIGTMITPVILKTIFNVDLNNATISILRSLSPLYVIASIMGKTSEFVIFGQMPLWLGMIIGYIILSVFALIASYIRVKYS